MSHIKHARSADAAVKSAPLYFVHIYRKCDHDMRVQRCLSQDSRIVEFNEAYWRALDEVWNGAPLDFPLQSLYPMECGRSFPFAFLRRLHVVNGYLLSTLRRTELLPQALSSRGAWLCAAVQSWPFGFRCEHRSSLRVSWLAARSCTAARFDSLVAAPPVVFSQLVSPQHCKSWFKSAQAPSLSPLSQNTDIVAPMYPYPEALENYAKYSQVPRRRSTGACILGAAAVYKRGGWGHSLLAKSRSRSTLRKRHLHSIKS
eukprot:6176912-Pleurochrysis_carterae.AAC.3